LARAGEDALLASIGRVFHADTGLGMGGKAIPQPPLAELFPTKTDEITIAVVGAHLSGMALNGELQALGARLLAETATAPDYKLYALNGTNPPKLSIGTVKLSDGQAVKGFLVEPAGLDGAKDISGFGGWRAYMASADR
jgi:allophanate hydrolase